MTRIQLIRKIDRIERQMTSHWGMEMDELRERAAEEQARERFMEKQQPKPSRLRRWVEQGLFLVAWVRV